jgi:heat-inducible transcriptional repressor
LWQGFAPAVRPSIQAVVDALKEVPRSGYQERLVLAGTSNLARASADFPSFMSVLEVIEEQVVLLKLLTDMSADSGKVAWVRRELKDCTYNRLDALATGARPE